MANWLHNVKLTHLFAEEDDLEVVQRSMTKIADAIKKESCFEGLETKEFYAIPEGDEVITPVLYAEKLLDRLYDFADLHRIWIE